MANHHLLLILCTMANQPVYGTLPLRVASVHSLTGEGQYWK